MTTSLYIDRIRIDGGTQSRVEMNNAAVEDYAAKMADGVDLPPVVVFFDGASYWLADGFHRYWAAKKNEAESIAADMREGTQWDAVLFAVGANSALGRTPDDKRKSVFMLLDGRPDEWTRKSANEIAKQCQISVTTAGKYREEWISIHGGKMDSARVVTRNGKTYEQDTSNIGKSRKPKAEQLPSGEVRMHPVQPPMSATPSAAQDEQKHQQSKERRPDPPSNGMQFARIAIMKLEQITQDDMEREQAFRFVIDWAKGQLNEA